MALELRKATPVKLRSVGLDEKWLQDRIAADPALLGIGDLLVLQRERSQPSGGRIDFLMYDPDNETRYEIEIMLGSLDESHIIRTIEYWDIERQRYPGLEHRAVIVAEEITSRFFNVIRLLNRSVPMIALQLNAFVFGESIVLQFTKVLDVYELGGEEEEGTAEQSDRRYWEERAGAASLAIADSVISMLPPTARIAYNRGHIAIGTSGYNFCWLRPRRTHCHVHLRVGSEHREAVIARLEGAAVSCRPYQRHSIRLGLTAKQIEEHAELICEVLLDCEQRSRE